METLVKRCCDYYWAQENSDTVIHLGCYRDSKWRKWIKKKTYSIPNICEDFKEKSKVDEA